MKFGKISAAVTALVMTAGSLSFSSFASIAADSESTSFPYTIEAEDMTDDSGNKPQVWTAIYNDKVEGDYTGEGFVYLTATPYKFTVTVDKDGMYDLKLRAAQILDQKGRQQSVEINGVQYTKVMPYSKAWTDFDFGKIRLKSGENTIKLTCSYGYMAVDSVTVSEAAFPDLSQATDIPCDKDATQNTKNLMKYLKSVYGSNIISGQQQIYGGGNSVSMNDMHYDSSTNKVVDGKGNTYTFDPADVATADDGSKFVWKCFDSNGRQYNYNQQNRNYSYNDYDKDINLIKDMTGKYPAIQGFDFGSYCPCYAWDDGVAQRMIDWGKKGGIITASWHVNVPTALADYTLGKPLDFAKTTYTQKTDFVTANCMVEGTTEYEYFKLCMKNLAAELKKVQDAGYPIIFRPFHEAEGNGGADGSGAWFWWSKEGTTVYKDLWKYLYTTLTEEYGLHNLIWEENLYSWSDASAEWYVGDDYVDIVGFDKYNTQYNRHDGKTTGPNLDAESGIFWNLEGYVNGKKMVSMPENDSVPSLDNLQIEQAKWLYFCIWYDSDGSEFVSGDKYQDKDELKKLYNSDYCITLDELPKIYENNPVVTTTSDATTTDITTTTVSVTATDPKTTSGSSETTAISTVTTSGRVSDTTAAKTTEETKVSTTGSKELKVGIGEVSEWGDTNIDGSVTIADSVFLQRVLVGASDITPQGLINADLYQGPLSENIVDSQDSEYLMKYLVKSIEKSALPVAKAYTVILQ